MKRRIVITILVVALGFVALAIRAFQQPVPRQKLDSLKLGMSKEEVRTVLGPPTKEYGHGQWTYSRPLVFGFVNLHWDEEGNYPGHYNYERF